MFEILDPTCTPERATEFSSCVDLFAREDVIIVAGCTEIVPLGVKIDRTFIYDMFSSHDGDTNMFLKSHCLELKGRSSLPIKKGLIVANGVGEIDLDYPGELGILLHNPIVDMVSNPMGTLPLGKDKVPHCHIKKGDKIAQIKLVEHKSYLMGYESDTVRDGGFGSSDKK